MNAHVTVYDNESNDGSYEFLKKIPFVTVKVWKTNGILDDMELLRIKNMCWKNVVGKTDFVIVSDMDECLFIDEPELILREMKNENIATITPEFLNLISYVFPKYDGRLMHNIVDTFYIDEWKYYNDIDKKYDRFGKKQKMLVFNPNLVKETNYLPGCYESKPEICGKCIQTNKIKCFHFHDIGLCRKIERYKERKDRMSETNIKLHLSDFYLEDKHKTISDFMLDLKNSKRFLNANS